MSDSYVNPIRNMGDLSDNLEKIRSKSRLCQVCNKEYYPTGPSQKYCLDCKKEAYKKIARPSQDRHRERKGVRVGIGSGNFFGKGSEHPSYKNGISTYRRICLESHEHRCNRCSVLINLAQSYTWCVHHIDHNRENNNINNLELLCKRCHQLEHNCQDNLPSN